MRRLLAALALLGLGEGKYDKGLFEAASSPVQWGLKSAISCSAQKNSGVSGRLQKKNRLPDSGMAAAGSSGGVATGGATENFHFELSRWLRSPDRRHNFSRDQRLRVFAQ